MTTGENKPIPRPADPFTAQDGIRLYELLDRHMREIRSELEKLSNRIAIQQKNQIEMLETLNVIEAGLSESRVGRIEIEVMEEELERELVEKRLEVIKAKLEKKQEIKDKHIDTHERIQQAATAAVSNLEKQKRESQEAYYLDLRRSITKAVLTTLAVGATGAVVAFILFLIRLYWTGNP